MIYDNSANNGGISTCYHTHQFNLDSSTTTAVIRFHSEYEKLIPKLKSEEYKELKRSIALHGLYHLIIINNDGFILDGHHRFNACTELGILPKFEVKGLEDPYKKKIYVGPHYNHRCIPSDKGS